MMRARRLMLGLTPALVAMLQPTTMALARAEPAPAPASMPTSPAVRDDFTVAAVGDLIYLRAMLPTIEARSPQLLRLLREADLSFGNFETNIFDLAHFAGAPQAESGGTWMFGATGVPADVRAMGFDLVGTANNHTTDWGVEGMAETLRRLTENGVVHAGAGASLSLARAPAYVDLPAGRIGLVAAASSFTPMSRAADPAGRVPGRAGLNPLRVTRTVLVPPADMAVIEHIAKAAGGRNGPKEDGVELMGARYGTGAADDPVAYRFTANPRDVAGNLRSIRQARQNGNFAIFSLHNHEPGNEFDTPADFAPVLARQAIDAGADMYVGHGPHQLRGIEIYKGKPIFYSLGNFAMMNNSLDDIPADMYEDNGADPASLTPPQLLHRRNAKSFSNPRFFESIVAVSRFTGGKVAEIRLYPLDLGLDAAGADKGVPTLASPAVGRRILERLQRLSAPFGTRIAIEDGVGIIRP